MTAASHLDAAARDQASRLRELVAAFGDDGSPTQQSATARDLGEPASLGATRILAIASGKGGVGKTSMAVNLCVVMARRGVRTVLFDGDLGLANADLLCGVKAASHVGHILSGARTIHDVLIDAPGGFRLLPGGGGLAQLATATAQERRSLVDALSAIEQETDLVVIDCGAGAGDGVLSFLQAADLPLLVTTPEPTSVTDAYALFKRLHAGGQSAVAPGLLVNQAKDSEEAMRVYRRINAVCMRFLGAGPDLVGWTPRDDAVARAVAARRPFALAKPRSRPARRLRRAAAAVQTRLALTPARPVGRLGRLARLFGSRRAGERDSRR